MNFDYIVPTKILFGAGRLNDLATVELPGKKVLVVISRGNSVKKYGYLDRVLNLLKIKNVESVVYDKILPNPIKDHVMEAAEIAKREGCDFIIGLGGGSSIDSAKSIAIMAKNPGDYWDYISGGTGRGKPVENGALPIVAITTTAGTGTEVDPWTVITKEDTKEKIGFGLIPETFPAIAIVDPELMLTVPPKLTAYQGFDALFHAVEGYIASMATPISDVFALKSIELISKYLPMAVENGNDIEARTMVALANTLSGFVESTSSCTSEHSMEHALSAWQPELPHGAGLIIISEAYHSFFIDKISDRYIEMARVMGENTDLLPEGERPKAFITALRKLKESCGVHKLAMSDFGFAVEDAQRLAENARVTMGGLFGVDRYSLSFEETVDIFSKAFN